MAGYSYGAAGEGVMPKKAVRRLNGNSTNIEND